MAVKGKPNATSHAMAVLAVVVAVAVISPSDCASARDGALDKGFGNAGKVFTGYPGGYLPTQFVTVARQSDGKLVIASSRHYSGVDFDFGAMRLLPDGSVDPSFGDNGQFFYGFDRAGSNSTDYVFDVAMQPDGKLILGGSAAGDASTGSDMAFVRLLANGTIDPGFGTAGATVVPFNLGSCVNGSCDDEALRVNLQLDGKILAAGFAFTDTGSIMAVTRLTATGQRDASFDVDGRVTLQFGSGTQSRGYRAKQIADGQHIVVVGGASTTVTGNLDFALARLNNDGSLDPTFGVGGKLTYAFDIGGDSTDMATDFVELADGRLMVCGEVQVNSPGNFDFGCMRFLANGIPDPAFSPLLVPIDAGGELSDVPFRIVQDAAGRFLLVGAANTASANYDFAVVRLTRTGLLDTTFGQGGMKLFDSKPGSGAVERSNVASDMLIEPDGKIVMAGYADINGAGDYVFELVRVIGDTVFDSGFEGIP